MSVVGKMKTRQKEVGFQVLVGAAQKLHPSLDAGAVGAILAFACVAPTACYEIYAAWKEGDAESGAPEAGADCRCRRARCGRIGHSGREVRHGFQRLLRRPGAPAAAAADRGSESGN